MICRKKLYDELSVRTSRAAIMTGKYPARLHLTDWLPGRNYRNLRH